MLYDFLSLPAVLMNTITILISTGLSVTALLIIRKNLNWESFKENHEVGGFLFNALGLIYAVLISFIVYATWSDYDSSLEYCDKEANSIQDLFLNSECLPEKYQPFIKEKIIEYLKGVIYEDWPLLSIDEGNPKTKDKLIEIWNIYLNIDTLKNEKQKIYYNISLSKLNDITDFRRLRLLSSQNHIPVLIWTVIIIGALTSVGFSLFFGTNNLIIQASMTSIFAMTNALILLLILNLDHPFTGDIKITTVPYEQILDFITNYLSK